VGDEICGVVPAANPDLQNDVFHLLLDEPSQGHTKDFVEEIRPRAPASRWARVVTP
jgi:hypothetical protein